MIPEDADILESPIVVAFGLDWFDAIFIGGIAAMSILHFITKRIVKARKEALHGHS